MTDHSKSIPSPLRYGLSVLLHGANRALASLVISRAAVEKGNLRR